MKHCRNISRLFFAIKCCKSCHPFKIRLLLIRGGFRVGAGGAPFFCNHLFEELQTALTDVKMIINNAPLTYFYPNTIKTCLTANHLLFDRQLLYYSNTKSTVVRNLTVFSSTTYKINRISNHFWDRWRHEYKVNLRETQRTSKLN